MRPQLTLCLCCGKHRKFESGYICGACVKRGMNPGLFNEAMARLTAFGERRRQALAEGVPQTHHYPLHDTALGAITEAQAPIPPLVPRKRPISGLATWIRRLDRSGPMILVSSWLLFTAYWYFMR